MEDLFKLHKELDNPTLASRESIEEIFKSGSPKYFKRKDNYGFGWRIKTGMDSTAYHFGWWKGFRSHFIRLIDQHKTLIVLSNSTRGSYINIKELVKLVG